MELLKLPETVRLKIFAHFNTSQLFLLSFCSSATREEVSKSIADQKSDCIAGVEWLDGVRALRFILSSEGLPCTWVCQTSDSLREATSKKCLLTIDGTDYQCRAIWEPTFRTDLIYLTNELQAMVTPIYIFQYLVSLSPIPLHSFVNLEACYVQKFLSFIETFDPVEVHILSGEMTADDVHQLCRVWKKPNDFTITRTIRGKLKSHLKMLRTGNLVAEDGSWMKRSHLLSFEGFFATIRRARLSAEDVIAFITKWLNGNDELLYILNVKFDEGYRLNTTKILKRFAPLPFDPERRAATFLYRTDEYDTPCGDGADGGDIFRSDGVLATIDLSPTELYFYVWHDRFPTQE